MIRRRLLSTAAVLAALALPACAVPPPPPAAAVAPAPPPVTVAETPPPKPNFIRVPMLGTGGVATVPVQIDEVCCINFVVDSGAADVSVSPAIFLAMWKSGRITRSDLIDVQRYQTANGVTEGIRFRFPSLTVGGITVHGVIGSVSKDSDMFLLGQSFLRKFRFWAIDNRTGELVLG